VTPPLPPIPSPVPQPLATGLRRRVGKWLGVTTLFAFIPLLFDVIILNNRGNSITMSALFSGASSYLIGFGICAAGFGDALFDKKITTGLIDGPTVGVTIVSAVMLSVGAVLYALNKSSPELATQQGTWVLPVAYLAGSTVVSLVTVLVTGR